MSLQSSRFSLVCYCLLALLVHGGVRASDAFVRGDVNADAQVNITDAVGILRHVLYDETRFGCERAADVNADGWIQIDDAVFLLAALFLNSSPPPPPFPKCGPDLTPSHYSCREHAPCSHVPLYFTHLVEWPGMVFIIDRSSSMVDSKQLSRAKREIISVLGKVPSATLFSLLFFDRGLLRFPDSAELLPATSENIAAAQNWVEEIRGGNSSCLGRAIDAALEAVRNIGVRGIHLIIHTDRLPLNIAVVEPTEDISRADILTEIGLGSPGYCDL